MKKKTKITLTASTLAVFSLVITASQTKPQVPMSQPDVRPVPAVIERSGDSIPPSTEIDFEPENSLVDKDISDLIDSYRDKATLAQVPANNTDKITAVTTEKEEVEVMPTGTPTPPQNTAVMPTNEPQMSDTRVVDDKKQVYFLGFGWIEDNRSFHNN